LIGMLPAVLLALVGVLLSLRRDYPWAEGAWLAVPLLTLGLVLTFMRIFSDASTYSPLPFVTLPLGGCALAALILHWLSTPGLHTRLMQLVLGLSGLVILVFVALPGWSEGARMEQVSTLVAGLLAALTWRALEGRRLWRTLACGLLLLAFASAAVRFFWPVETPIPYPPEWVRAVITLSAIFGLAAGPLLAGWLAYASLAKPGKLAPTTLIASLAGIALLCVPLFAIIWNAATNEKISEEGIVPALYYFLGAAGALTALLAAAWRLEGRRKLAAILVMALFLAALAPAISGPAATAEELTVQRAAQVDGAIQRFQARTGRYPSDLGELTPWTIWRIPAPVTYFRQVWCYAGSPDAYRLGYYFGQRQPGYWMNYIEVRTYATAGPQPPALTQCEAELEEAR
jgi:hypothetical protein